MVTIAGVGAGDEVGTISGVGGGVYVVTIAGVGAGDEVGTTSGVGGGVYVVTIAGVGAGDEVGTISGVGGGEEGVSPGLPVRELEGPALGALLGSSL